MSGVDVLARGIAVRADRRIAAGSVLARLARGIARGCLPELTAKDVAVAATSPVSAFPGGATDWFPYSAGVKDKFDNFSFLRGEWLPGSGTFPQNYFARCYAVTSGAGGAQQGTGPAPLVRFWTDAPDFEVVFYGTASATAGGYRVRCDGEYLTDGAIGLGGNAGTTTYGRITWGDGSPSFRKARLYEIEGLTAFWLKGLRLPTVSKAWAAPPTDGLRVIVHGDGFVDGSGASVDALHGSLAAQVALLLGQSDTAGSGVRGTGFVANGAGARITFAERVQPDIIAKAPDVVIELGGIDDLDLIDENPHVMQAAVEQWLDRVQAALPETLIFMTGPMTPGSPSAGAIAARDGKKAACKGRRNVIFIDNLAENWVTGTGRSGSPTGDGNADWVTGGLTGSETPPTDAGQAYLAQRIVEAIAARIPAI